MVDEMVDEVMMEAVIVGVDGGCAGGRDVTVTCGVGPREGYLPVDLLKYVLAYERSKWVHVIGLM